MEGSDGTEKTVMKRNADGMKNVSGNEKFKLLYTGEKGWFGGLIAHGNEGLAKLEC